MKKQVGFKTKGMNQDLSVSAFNPEFSFENINLRLSTNEGNTLMSWVNERGTALLDIFEENENGNPTETLLAIIGTPIGTAIINHYLILFTKGEDYDYIYRLKYIEDNNEDKTRLQGKVICKSVSNLLGFSIDHPLETLVSYESDLIQKVYWTDGVKQPRVINILHDYGTYEESKYCPFDFVRELQLTETIKVEKQLSASGMFAPGVIQYAFTYYDKYGQESNIFYTSPLQYISYKERGASPEDKVGNAFRISIENPDTHFQFLRIYSIQRTSINGTPFCKRIQDISLEKVLSTDTVFFIDTGMSGNSVDPTELLYKGGDIIAVETMEQKDSTLFMGGISLTRPSIVSLKNSISVNITDNATRSFKPVPVSSGYYKYDNQLTSKGTNRHEGMTVPCGGFKTGETYRLGIQFQHNSGKWSEPLFLDDYIAKGKFDFTPNVNGNIITVPIFEGTLNSGAIGLLNNGYKRMRPVVVFPSMIDRNIICQGVSAPTVLTSNNATDGNCFRQSSWFFRPYVTNDDTEIYNKPEITSITPKSDTYLRYTSRQISNSFPQVAPIFNPKYIRQVEIEGEYENGNKFSIDRTHRTFHSPDIEFDDQLALIDFTGKMYKQRGKVKFEYTMSDIDIQTETPTASNSGSGFVHKPLSSEGARGIVSGLFYDDFLLDDQIDGDKIKAYPPQKQSCKWLVYPWQGSGYLNNDFNRPADRGVPSAKLKKKVISNLRYADTNLDDYSSGLGTPFAPAPQLFSSNEVSILKFDGNLIYKGNIDTVLIPDYSDGNYFCFNGWIDKDEKTPFDSNEWCKTFNNDPNTQDKNGIRKWNGSDDWEYGGDHIGDEFVDLVLKKSQVRMKYKSTPHIFAQFNAQESDGELAVFEITQNVNTNTRFGGKSDDAKRENVWIPCGEPVAIAENAKLYWDYGDTYYQRYDCLKTYPFTKEDINQIVEIGSFMLETRVNIDGRYDRNRGQSNNLYMSPQNFNLINPVYSQIDNFFTYRIMPEDYYENITFPNQITWSKTKENGADVDLWTNVTLASILELDGDKGKINKLVRFNNYLFAFQDSGIAQILYNDNVQISATDGVPIEIANSGKVGGKDYKSNTVGCSNKWSMTTTPNGVYFMDSNDKSIYLFNGQLNSVSGLQGFNTWCKNHIPTSDVKWDPVDFENFISFYDRLNQDVLFVNKDEALAFSEKIGTFTSFYDYSNTPFFCNLDDTGIWVGQSKKLNDQEELADVSFHLWKHRAGDYCRFFDVNKPYSMTLVGNPEPQIDKIFTNLEFRACVEGDGESDQETGKFTPTLPFDSLETWDEYQHGITGLENKNGHDLFKHGGDSSALIRKFRIWRSDIPRDNVVISVPDTATEEDKAKAAENKEWDKKLGVSRIKQHPVDRMRNPWLYLKLMKNAAEEDEIIDGETVEHTLDKAEIHDIVMTYFG